MKIPKWLLYTTIVFSIIGLIVYAFFATGDSTKITISNDTIQTVIDKKIPLQKHVMFADVSITKANVVLNDNVEIESYGVIKSFGKTVPFKSKTSGELEMKNKQFFFKPQNVSVELLPIETNETSTIGSKIFDKVVSKSKEIGINKSDVENTIVNMTKEKVSTIPLYTLEGVARASIKSVKIEGNNIVVHASIMNAILFYGVIVVGVILAIILVAIIISAGGGEMLLFGFLFAS